MKLHFAFLQHMKKILTWKIGEHQGALRGFFVVLFWEQCYKTFYVRKLQIFKIS